MLYSRRAVCKTVISVPSYREMNDYYVEYTGLFTLNKQCRNIISIVDAWVKNITMNIACLLDKKIGLSAWYFVRSNCLYQHDIWSLVIVKTIVLYLLLQPV